MTQKSKAHQRYRNAENKIVPGVTTVLDVRAKPALVAWANRLGLQGIDSTKYKDEMADVGTLAHQLIMYELTHKEHEITEFIQDYSARNIQMAQNSIKSFHTWMGEHQVIPILCEEQLVSEKYQCGGTVDLYAAVDGMLTIVDFKTGSGIYVEAQCQVAAYTEILREHGYQVDGSRILRIGRDESEGFEEITPAFNHRHLRIFELCREMYELNKELRRTT